MAAAENPLYRIKIVDRSDARSLVKVHFVGYKSTYDEWKRLDELVILNDDNDNSATEETNQHTDNEIQTVEPTTSSIK